MYDTCRCKDLPVLATVTFTHSFAKPSYWYYKDWPETSKLKYYGMKLGMGEDASFGSLLIVGPFCISFSFTL